MSNILPSAIEASVEKRQRAKTAVNVELANLMAYVEGDGSNITVIKSATSRVIRLLGIYLQTVEDENKARSNHG